MKIVIFPICFLLLLYGNLYSQTKEKGLSLEAGTTYNTNNFNWSIAGNLEGSFPNILSELKFNKITSLGYYLKSNYTPLAYLKFFSFFQQNKVINGNGSDIDYKDDNRTNPTFENNFISNKGDFVSFKGGIGTPIRLSTKINITPALFYCLTKQKFYILSNEIQDLRSIYKANMQGVEISMKGNIQLNKIIYSSLILNYHFVNYKAEANWNLIDIFQHPLSFSHISNGTGFGVNALLGCNMSKMFSIIVSGSLNTTTIRKGTDITYLITENEILTQFNGAKSILYGLSLGIRTSF